jgi:hypothetical protein
MFKHSYHFTAIPVLPDCVIPVECPPKDGEISCTDNGSIDMGDCNGPPKRCRQKNIKPWIWEFDDNTIINKRLPKYNIYYHIFCCNMFVFACSLIAKSQCWLFAIQRLKYDLMHIFMHHISLYFDSKVYNLWDHSADTGSWIRGQIRTYEGKYGYVRANTDSCSVWQITNTDF